MLYNVIVFKKKQLILFKVYFSLVTFIILSCNNTNNFKNELSNESSEYLLQHANNPVAWKAWNDRSLKLAKDQNKLMIISIGYSACHWCHVMEKESFENDSIAKFMNENFINIKVDREERPDVNNIYLSAVQLMTGKGGWPLNCITLPDGKPIFGGTYFSKKQWKKILEDIVSLYKKNPVKVLDYADKLTEGIKNSQLIELKENKVNFTNSKINEAITNWKPQMDTIYGGLKGNIKFPMPTTLDFLLRYSFQFNDKEVMEYVTNSLKKMGNGGIFDHVNGGFSRYSTDKKWHIPHFEKMLYDNAQLVSIYSKAYQYKRDIHFKNIVEETLFFIDNELTNKKNGTYYSTIDADSKNEKNKTEEGAYYYWKEKELQIVITNSYNLFKDYYSINNLGLWENEKFVLFKSMSDLEFLKKHNIDKLHLYKLIKQWKKMLREARVKKSKPKIDNSIITSWNALMIKGYIDAYKALGHKKYLVSALKNANFIFKNQLKDDGSLFRSYKNGKSSINAYAEDYATLIDAYISLYEVTFDYKWLQASKKLTDYVIKYFLNSKNKMFYFTSSLDQNLISKDIAIDDYSYPFSFDGLMVDILLRTSQILK